MSQQGASPQITFELFREGAFLGLKGRSGGMRSDIFSRQAKILLLITVTWLPMLLLTALGHMALGTGGDKPFLSDISVHVRFLITLPLILVIPAKISGKLELITDHFLKAKLVGEHDRERFLDNIRKLLQLRNSRLPDWIMVGVAYFTSICFLYFLVPTLQPSWRTIHTDGVPHPSLAGYWFLWVAEPIYEVVFYRFFYRVALWWVFLWKTSRLHLEIDAAHPDAAGGLGFLGLSLRTFKEAAFAIATAFASPLATVVLLTNGKVSSYRYEIVVIIVGVTLLFAGPLLFFHGALVRAKSRDTLQYWTLWQVQQRQFQCKWLQNPAEHADMLSVPDFSEATDLSQILERIRQVQLVPFGRKQVQPLVVAALIPFVVVAILEFPLEEILKQVLKLGLKF